MKIFRSDLQRFEEPRHFRESLFDISIHDLGNPETPVELELQVRPQGEDFLLNGVVRTNLTLTCDRCLGEAPYAVEGKFNLWLVAEMRPDLDANEEEILLVPTHQQEVDLAGTIAETIRIEIPQKTLCREDCKGLCPSCGADLNQQPCGCATEEIDERWSALLAIKKQLEK